MADMDDYFAFLCTGSDSDTDNSSGNGNSGCSGGCLTWVVGILVLLWFVGKFIA